MAAITPEEKDLILKKVSNELDRMERAQIETIKQSEQSFSEWVKDCLTEIGRTIGVIIAAPIKFVVDVVKGFFDALFDW